MRKMPLKNNNTKINKSRLSYKLRSSTCGSTRLRLSLSRQKWRHTFSKWVFQWDKEEDFYKLLWENICLSDRIWFQMDKRSWGGRFCSFIDRDILSDNHFLSVFERKSTWKRKSREEETETGVTRVAFKI